MRLCVGMAARGQRSAGYILQLVAQALVFRRRQRAVDEGQHQLRAQARVLREHELSLPARFIDATVHHREEAKSHGGVLRRRVHGVELSDRLLGFREAVCFDEARRQPRIWELYCGLRAMAARYSARPPRSGPSCRSASATRILGIQ